MQKQELIGMSLNNIKDALKECDFVQAFNLIEEFLGAQQDNPYLWNLRGNVIQLLDIPDHPPLSEVERSYLKALEINPDDLDSIESLAHYYDALLDDVDQSKKYAQLYLDKTTKVRSAMDAILQGTSYQM